MGIWRPEEDRAVGIWQVERRMAKIPISGEGTQAQDGLFLSVLWSSLSISFCLCSVLSVSLPCSSIPSFLFFFLSHSLYFFSTAAFFSFLRRWVRARRTGEAGGETEGSSGETDIGAGAEGGRDRMTREQPEG